MSNLIKKIIKESIRQYLNEQEMIKEYNNQDSFLSNYESARKFAYDNIDDVAVAFVRFS